MKTIAVANQKGGTGKTTTAVTLSHKLALCEGRVLLVDTDPQGHVARALGRQKGGGIWAAVQWYADDSGLIITEGRHNLDLIPSDRSTNRAKQALVTIRHRESVLSKLLGTLHAEYDCWVNCRKGPSGRPACWASYPRSWTTAEAVTRHI